MLLNLGMFSTLISLIYLSIIFILYFYKKRVHTVENRIYKKLLFINLLSIVVELSLYPQVLGQYYGETILIDTIYLFLAKIFVCLIFLWTSNLLYYTILISKQVELKNFDTKEKLSNKTSLIFNLVQIIIVIIILMLKVELYKSDNVGYTYGQANTFGFMLVFLSCILMFGIILIRWSKVKKNKTWPIMILVVLIFVSTLIQAKNPGTLLFNLSLSLVTFIMYHTIENPDIKMLNQLELAKDHADKANRAKSDFLSSMSHEIRTPLNAIVGFSECISQEDNLEAAKEDAKDIIMASKNLLEIVNGILDISKIEADKMEIIESDYELRPILDNLAKLIIPRIGDKPIELKTEFAPDIPSLVHGDSGKVKQVITNILTNAAKYTDKGTITFKVSCVNEGDDCNLVISVQDTGRGIKQEQVNKLFNKFERLDEERNTTTEGTGLGLAITKRLTEMMGGKIVVQSNYGQGSNFIIYLKQRIVKLHEGEQTREEVTTDVSFEGNKLLVVDDNKLNLKVINKMLVNYKIDTTLIDSGFECLEKIQNGEKFDLILMDDMMPKMSGKETFKKLKELENFNIPVVVLTANALSGMEENYLKIGFDAYLAKPLDKNELLKVLTKYLNSKDSDNVIIEKEDNNMNNYDVNYLKSNGIDVDAGIEILGDMDMYNDTLNDFLEESKLRIPRLEESKNNNDMENYAIDAHAMKSDSKYLGFTKLAELSLGHELKGKENDVNYVNEHYNELMDEYHRIETIIKNYLNK